MRRGMSQDLLNLQLARKVLIDQLATDPLQFKILHYMFSHIFSFKEASLCKKDLFVVWKTWCNILFFTQHLFFEKKKNFSKFHFMQPLFCFQRVHWLFFEKKCKHMRNLAFDTDNILITKIKYDQCDFSSTLVGLHNNLLLTISPDS